MPAPIASNKFLLSLASWQRSRFNTDHVMGLFQSNSILTPATVISDLTDASFSGYSPIGIVNYFPAPFRVVDGEYVTQPDPFTWLPLADSAQLIYGWYLFGLGQLEYSALFPAPLPVIHGVPIHVTFALQTWALAIACP